MSATAEFEAEIARRVLAAHHLVLARATEYYPACSYRMHLSRYTHAKLRLRHMIEREVWRGQVHAGAGGIINIENRHVESLRAMLYNSPCFECSACKSRRKPWPYKRDLLSIPALTYAPDIIYTRTIDDLFHARNHPT